MSSQTSNVRTCRICLVTGCFEDCVLLSDSTWSQMYEFCLGLPIHEKDATVLLCNMCAKKLQDFAKFKKQCLKTDLFWKSISQNMTDNVEYQHIDEKQTNDCKDVQFGSALIESFDDDEVIPEEPNINIVDNNVLNNVVLKVKDNKIESKLKLTPDMGICRTKLLLSNRNKTENVNKIKSNVFYCGLCDYSNKDIESIKKHLSVHSSNNDLNCNLCDFTGRDFADMVSHRYIHHPDEHFLILFCHACNKRGRSSLSLQFHYRKFHLNKNGGLCSFCNKSFSSYKVFRDHEKLHSTDRCYVCDHCGMKFLYKHKIIVHLEQHENIRRFVCETCGQRFKRKSGLNDHMRVHIQKVGVKCTHCNRNFKSQIHLAEHIKRVNREKNYICPICSKAYTFETEMRRHMYWHTDVKPFRCEVCGQTYKTKGYMKVHMLTHTGHFPYKCPSCDKPFISRGAVRRHQSVHTGIRAYKCGYCEKSFHNRKLLVVHCKSRHKEYSFDDNKN